jgi:hypothetical protein
MDRTLLGGGDIAAGEDILATGKDRTLLGGGDIAAGEDILATGIDRTPASRIAVMEDRIGARIETSST